MRVVMFIICMILFLGGLALFGYAPLVPPVAGFLFFGGILCVSAAFAVPMYVLPKFD